MKIGDVEKLTGLSAKTIRYYESRRLIQVARSDNMYRDYDDETVDILRSIKTMREIDIAVADIKLWCDGVVETRELVAKKLSELDDNDARSESRKEICKMLLSGKADMVQSEFCEPELMEPDMAFSDKPLALGVDIGTTSISAQLLSLEDGSIVHTYTLDHNCKITLEGWEDAYAADGEKLIDRLLRLAASVVGSYQSIVSIGVTGQMHGIVCLNSRLEIISPLYTWQNGFGQRTLDGVKICDCIEGLTGEAVPTGYGIVTCYALSRLGLLPEGTAKIATIMDAAVMRLCGSDKVMTHATNAASLGLFDVETSQFSTEKLGRLQIDNALLPEVTPDYCIAGAYKGIPVAVAIGDNQAGIFGAVCDDRQVLVNVGTSSQVSMIVNGQKGWAGELRPYFDGKMICSGAALCGGCAYAALADFFCRVTEVFGMKIKRSAAYEFMNQAALASMENPLEIITCFSGTRENAGKRGSINNLGLTNFTPEHFAAGIVNGIAGELHEMYEKMAPGDEMQRQIVVSGNAIRRNAALCKTVGRVFGGEPLVPAHLEEAAYGAALYGAIASEKIQKMQAVRLIQYQNREC